MTIPQRVLDATRRPVRTRIITTEEGVEGELGTQGNSKRPRLAPLDITREISSGIRNPPSRFALNKLKNFKYVELWYFTPEARDEAAKSDFTVDDDAFSLTEIDGVISLVPMLRGSPNVLRDEELSWEKMIEAKIDMLDRMDETGWPSEYTQCLSDLFTKLSWHDTLSEPDGRKILATYVARARHEWHRQLENTTGDSAFNIGLINEALLSDIGDQFRKIRNKLRDKELFDSLEKSVLLYFHWPQI